MSDKVLKLNKRGHSVSKTKQAFELLRSAGFKIHAHWMANLYGSNVKNDIKDFQKLFSDSSLRPDELKIYPCSLIAGTELMQYYKSGKWKPYNYRQLLKVLTECIKSTPQYCRLTRIVRDIPAEYIVAGNKKSNFRQIAERELKRQGVEVREIRNREIRSQKLIANNLKLKTIKYKTSVGEEWFLQFITQDDKLLAFLRLTILNNKKKHFIPELTASSIIREVHVYGPVVRLSQRKKGRPQHMGLGKNLIEKAIEISQKAGYKKISVISAIGTREYYRKLGFKDGELYQHKIIK